MDLVIIGVFTGATVVDNILQHIVDFFGTAGKKIRLEWR